MVLPTVAILMKVLNRTKIVGKENLKGLNGRWILTSNHLTMVDDIFLDLLIMFPGLLRNYDTVPFHAPEERNFYNNWFVAWFMRTGKSIPLIRGRGINQEGMNRIIRAVQKGGIIHIYPEGTRSRTGAIGEGKLGVAKLAYESGAPVVPVYYRGLETILPIGCYVPRIGKHVEVMVGKPIYFEEELKMENNPHTLKIIIDKIMAGILAEKERAEQLWGPREFQMSEKVKKEMEAAKARKAKQSKVASPTDIEHE